jgi:hypothetical protein
VHLALPQDKIIYRLIILASETQDLY